MKRLFAVLLALIVVSGMFLGCSKSDPSATVTLNALISNTNLQIDIEPPVSLVPGTYRLKGSVEASEKFTYKNIKLSILDGTGAAVNGILFPKREDFPAMEKIIFPTKEYAVEFKLSEEHIGKSYQLVVETTGLEAHDKEFISFTVVKAATL